MTDVVTINVERLRQLEAIEAKVKAHNLKSLTKLLEKKANSPTPIHAPTNKTTSTARVMRHIEKNRDEYNARRREKRRLLKEACASKAADIQPAPLDG